MRDPRGQLNNPSWAALGPIQTYNFNWSGLQLGRRESPRGASLSAEGKTRRLSPHTFPVPTKVAREHFTSTREPHLRLCVALQVHGALPGQGTSRDRRSRVAADPRETWSSGNGVYYSLNDKNFCAELQPSDCLNAPTQSALVSVPRTR